MDIRRNLYHARINRRLTLEQIGVRTALSPSVLRNLDQGKFELLPSGVYARSYVRTFAEAVGLDPEAALAEIEHLLPGTPDPLPALNARTSHAFPLRQELANILSALADRTKALRSDDLSLRARDAASRLLARPGLTRLGAATIDALLLLIVDAFLVMLISWSSGIPVELLLREAGLALGAFCAIPVALYFLLFGGIGGSTLGRYICSLYSSLAADDDADRHGHPLTLPDILRRAVRR